jgi:putative cell wall-binding protein
VTRRTGPRLLAVLLVAGLTPALVPSGASAAPTASRIEGTGRYETAAAVSASSYDPGVPVAYVATGQSFPDALAGSPAATVEGGPVVLVRRDEVPTATGEELARLRPARIVVLGGESAVSAVVERELADYTTGTVTRLAGPSRYETAAAISRAVFDPGVERVYVTTGLGFADALSAGPPAGLQGAPVLLTAPGALPDATRREIERLAPRQVVVLGGAAAVWPATEEALRRLAPSFDRVFGGNRYTTSASIARAGFPGTVETAYLATGADFPDALAGGPVAARDGGPLLLVQKDCIPAAVQAEIVRLDPDRLVVLGGETAVSAAVERGTVCPSGPSTEPTGRVAGGPARDFVVESPDYASEAHSDPWDYSNAEDEHTGTPQMSNAGTISGGQLAFTTATAFPWIDPVPYLPGSQPQERDGPRAPIDAGRYTHLSFRMFAEQAGAGILVWAGCDWSTDSPDGSCEGAQGVAVRQGWHTYDIRLQATDPNLRRPWSGSIFRLRFVVNDKQGVDTRVDWLRLRGTAPQAVFGLERAGAGDNELYWDSDGSLANNTPDQPGWGPLGRTSTDSATFPVEQFPPGSYRLYTRLGGTTGPYTEPLTILPRPRPVVDSPSLVGGQDYATTVRGNAWDFTGLDDVTRGENFCNGRIVDGTVLAANNCAGGNTADRPEIDNPHFTLPQVGPIDANTFHRATVRIRYDGPFGLTGGPTGGAVARLIWYVARDGQGTDYNSYDIVLYPGWNTVSFDLKTNPPSDIVDEAAKRGPFGWANEQVLRLRLDPNEDVSERRWYVDYVKLTSEDRGRGGFSFQLHDESGLGGQSATVFLDNDRSGTNGTRVSGAVPLVGGSNTIRVDGLPRGRWWPYVVLDGPAGGAVRYAEAPVIID